MAGHNAPYSRDAQASLPVLDYFVGAENYLRIDYRGRLHLGGVRIPVVRVRQHDEDALSLRDLRRGNSHAVGLERGGYHVVYKVLYLGIMQIFHFFSSIPEYGIPKLGYFQNISHHIHFTKQ